MKKIILMLTILVLMSNFSSALSPINAPECFVRGEIVNVEFKEAVDYSEPNLPAPSYPDRFVLTILVKEVDLIGSWEHDFSTCDYFYSVGENVDISISKNDVVNEKYLYPGVFIEGRVVNHFGPFFVSDINFEDFDGLVDNSVFSRNVSSEFNMSFIIMLIALLILSLVVVFFVLKKKKT